MLTSPKARMAEESAQIGQCKGKGAFCVPDAWRSRPYQLRMILEFDSLKSEVRGP